MIRHRLAFPVLVAIYPALALYVHNLSMAPSPGSLVLLSAVSLAVAAALIAAMQVWLRDWRRSSLAAMPVLLFLLGYGHVLEAAQAAAPDGWPLGHPGLLLPAGALVVALLVRWIARTERDLEPATRGLNVASALLVAFNLALLGHHAGAGEGPRAERASEEGASEDDHQDLGLPDIYYVVPDGYTSNRTLAEAYGFDNRPFIEALRARGFVVAERSRANYPASLLSLASALNMRYLDDLARLPKELGQDRRVAQMLTYDSQVSRELRRFGYRYVFFDHYFGTNPYADEAVRFEASPGGGDLVLLFARMTALQPWHGRLLSGVLRSGPGEAILGALQHLPRVAVGQSRPSFVVAHINCPHPPFLFEADGTPRGGAEARWKSWEDREGYVAQVRFMNQRLLTVVDAIQAIPDRPAPVIVIQGDHGPNLTRDLHLTLESEAWDDESVAARMEILNAIHLPYPERREIGDTWSPVNTFRLVLHALLRRPFERLEDRSIWASYDALYTFTDVTARVDAARPPAPR